MKEIQKIHEEIQQLFECSNLENKKEFVKIYHYFYEDCDCILSIPNFNPLYIFLRYNGDICYLNGVFTPIIYVIQTKDGVNLRASEEFKQYLDSELFVKLYHEMTKSLLK